MSKSLVSQLQQRTAIAKKKREEEEKRRQKKEQEKKQAELNAYINKIREEILADIADSKDLPDRLKRVADQGKDEENLWVRTFEWGAESKKIDPVHDLLDE